MQFFQISPIVIVGIILQVCIQIWCVKKILNDDALTVKKKTIWIFVVIVFHLLGIDIFLFVTRNKSIDHKPKDFGNGFDENVQNCIFLLMLYPFLFLALMIIYANPNNMWIMWFLTISLILLVSLHFFSEKMPKILKLVLPYVLVVITTFVDIISITNEYKIIILVAVAAIIIEYPLKYTRLFFWIPLIFFQVGSLAKFLSANEVVSQDYLFSFVFKNTITYMMVIAAFYFAKRQLVMNNYLQYLMMELKNKTQELEEASVLKERNRIAREIHDTLGHTLTGAIIQLEVAKKMLYSNPEKAEISILETQDITRQGFSDVKRAIRALKPVMIDENTLEEGLQLLFERMEKDYGFSIDKDIELPDIISDDLKVSVFRIIQELFTNSRRHGNADKIEIKIEYQFDTLRINAKDNGEGCSLIKEGNGLRGIRERIEKLDGQISFSSDIGKGFGTLIYIPVTSE